MIEIVLLGDLDNICIYDLQIEGSTVLSGSREEIKDYMLDNLIDELIDMIIQ